MSASPDHERGDAHCVRLPIGATKWWRRRRIRPRLGPRTIRALRPRRRRSRDRRHLQGAKGAGSRTGALRLESRRGKRKAAYTSAPPCAFDRSFCLGSWRCLASNTGPSPRRGSLITPEVVKPRRPAASASMHGSAFAGSLPERTATLLEIGSNPGCPEAGIAELHF
jgi:hypothetical protein